MDDQSEQQVDTHAGNLAQINEQLQQEIIERRQAEQALRESEKRYRQQFEQTQAALVKAEALYRAASSLISFESLPEVLQAVVDGVAAALPANRVSLITLNVEKRELVHFVKGGPGADQIVLVAFDELWQGLSGWVMRELTPALSPKNIPDPRESLEVQQRRAETNCGAIIVVPVRYRNKTLGTLTAINRPDERDFTEQDVELMIAMANQAAVAIENTRLFHALRDSEARLRTVVKSAPIVLWALDREGVFTVAEGKGLEALGLKPNDVVGRSVYENYSDLPRVIVTGSRRALAGQTLTSLVDVAGLTWETRYSPLRDRNGAVVGAVSVATDISERMQAEEALAEERNLLRTLIDNIPDFIFVKDTETRFVINNKAHVKVLGANKQEEVLAKTDFEVFPEELASQYYADDTKVINTGQAVVDREEPYIDPDGNLKWLSTTKVALRDGQGEIVGLVGISRDITEHKRTNELLRDAHDESEMRVLERTAELAKANKILQAEIVERRQAEQALRESEARFAGILDIAKEAIISVDEVQKLIIFNKGAEEVFGYSAQEAIGQSLDLLIPERFRTIHRRHIVEFANNPTDASSMGEHLEIFGLRKNGQEFPAEATISKLELGSQKIFTVVLRDVSERKRADRALRESEQRYKQLLGSVTDYIYTVNVENGYVTGTTHSPNCVAVTGYTWQEYDVDPHLWYRMVHDEDKSLVMAQADKLLAGDTMPLEHRIIHKDGTVRWVRNTPVPRKDNFGNIISYDGLISDITERKQAEEALRKSESKYRMLMEHASDGIVIFDQDGNLLEVNSKVSEMLGFSQEQFLQRNVIDLIVKEDLAALPLGLDELRAGKTILRERRLYRKNGDILPGEVSARMIEDGRIQAIIRDITERKEVERREKLAYELGRQLTALLDPEALLAETVNRLKETFGYYHAQVYMLNEPSPDLNKLNKEEAVLLMQAGTGQAGVELKRRRHAISFQAKRSLVARAARQLEPVVVNEVSQDPDHLPNPLLPNTRSEVAIPLVTGQRLIGVLDIQHDIAKHFNTNEVRTLQIVANQLSVALANAQLFAENARRLAIIENSSDLVALCDLEDGSIIYMNPAGVQLTGYGHMEEVIGRPITTFYTLDGQRLVKEKGLPAALERGLWRGENCLRRNDGTLVPIEQTIFVTHKERGQAQMLATIISDITKRKQAEEEREHLFEEVKEGRERLRTLSHRLVEVQEAERRHIARELHDEVGQLLTGLKLTLEMSTNLQEDQAKAALSEARRLINDLISQVRELSLELRPAMLDDLGLWPTLQWHFERFYAQTKIRVKCEHSAIDRRFAPQVETTAYRIVQEALTNVARHANVAEVTVRLWVEQDLLKVEVEDHGSGFDLEAARSAADSSGLSGMHERAALLGGQVVIRSLPEAGTCLTAQLPLTDPAVIEQNGGIN